DGGLVDQAGVHAVGGQGGAGNDRGVVHDDGVALGVARAGAVAVDVADEFLFAHILGHAAGHHVGRAALAVEVHVKVGDGALVALGQMDEGGVVHDLFAAAVALAVVLLHIAQPGVLGQPEGVDAVVLGVAAAAVVDAAPGNDGHVGSFADVEVVVHQVLEAGL